MRCFPSGPAKFSVTKLYGYNLARNRLGAFGFLASSELLDEGEHGNAAFLDQRAAYAWVKKYIHKFGGDGDKITIM